MHSAVPQFNIRGRSAADYKRIDVAYNVLFMFSAEKKIEVKKRPAIIHYGIGDQTELIRLTLVLDQTLVLTSV